MQQDHLKVQIEIESPNQEDIMEMIRDLDSYLGSLYPSDSNHLLSVDSLMGEEVRFLVARVDGQALGCGALLLGRREYAEIKRMYVKPDTRGLGIGTAILRELEQRARNENCGLVRLETGIHQPEALNLYSKEGYVARGPFGDYSPDPLSVFMEKDLGSRPTHVDEPVP